MSEPLCGPPALTHSARYYLQMAKLPPDKGCEPLSCMEYEDLIHLCSENLSANSLSDIDENYGDDRATPMHTDDCDIFHTTNSHPQSTQFTCSSIASLQDVEMSQLSLLNGGNDTNTAGNYGGNGDRCDLKALSTGHCSSPGGPSPFADAMDPVGSGTFRGEGFRVGT